MEKFKEYLQHHTNLSNEQFSILSNYLKTSKVKKQTLLLNQGEICSHSFFVEEGLLRLYSISDAGKEHIIQFAPENWIVTDRSSTFFNQPSEFIIDSIEDSKVVHISGEFMQKASEINAGFNQYFEKLLHNHIRHIQHRLSFLLGANAEQRYMDFIKLYPDLSLRVPQLMIASYLGITPESLSRVRKELANKNFKNF
ncbi:MAG: Crp/Fnr family transcriptional regulator [Bacteroidetes bacterium]|nr:Crp/Fnr family transcriptional regulator [Bacteroidota bacterium]